MICCRADCWEDVHFCLRLIYNMLISSESGADVDVNDICDTEHFWTEAASRSKAEIC